jgi:cyclic-di-GMP-binding protein
MFSRRQKPPQPPAASTGGAEAEVAADSLSTLQQLSVRLERLAVTDEMSWARACELVERIDQGARSIAVRLMHEYVLGTQRPEDVRNEQVWSTATDYLDKLVHGHRWCLERYESDGGAGSASAATLAIIAARAIRACAERLTWAYLRYDAVAPAQWRVVKRAYFLTERAGVAGEAVVLPGVPSGSSTVEREFLKIVVLAASSPGGLLPGQIEIAVRLIERCAPDLALAQHSIAPASHFIDLTTTGGPRRLLASQELSGADRVIVLSGAAATLQQLAADLDEGTRTAGDLGLDPHSSAELVRGTVRHLLRHWSGSSLQRRHVRSREALRAVVVHDFEAMAAKVVGATSENPSASDEEHWIVEDRSAGGLLALVSRRQGRWIRAGTLIAFRCPDFGEWQAGIIRRVQREGNETRRVGIEQLSTEISGVMLMPRFQSQAGDPGKRTVGVFLVDSTAAADQVTLLLPAGVFSPSAPLEMNAGSRDYLLIPQELIESGHDYQIARYKRLDQAPQRR